MLQVLSTVVAKPALPDSIKDDGPPECRAEILEFEDYHQSQPTEEQLDEIVYFPITVDDSLSAEAQAIVDRSCGDSVLYLDIVSVPNKHQSKIWIGLKAAAFGIALHAVIMGLPSAELGMVRHIHSPTHAA